MESVFFEDLPTEILQQILNILYEERQYEVLKNCACTSHFLCTLSQRYILRRIVLPQETMYPDYHATSLLTVRNPAQMFLQVLDTSPHIAQYIRRLTIPCNLFLKNYVDDDDAEHHWLQTDTWLHPILPRLTNLSALSLCNERAGMHLRLSRVVDVLLEWSDFSDGSLQTSLSTALASPNLTEIDLTGIRAVPVHIFRCCKALKRLSIHSIDVNIDDEPSRLEEAPAANIPCRLEYLHLDEIQRTDDLSKWFSSPGCPLGIRNLQKFSFYLANHGIDPTSDPRNEFLSLCTESLLEVHIRVQLLTVLVETRYNTLNFEIRSARQDIPDLGAFVNITALTIDAVLTVRIFHHNFIDYYSTPIPWIMSLLRRNSQLKRLARLTLNLRFVSFPREQLVLLHENWTKLAETLANFPKFKLLELCIMGLDAAGIKELRKDACLSALAVQDRLVFLD